MKIQNVPRFLRLRSLGKVVLCKDVIGDDDLEMYLIVGVFHNRDIDIVRRRSGHSVYDESNLTCKQILFRILDIFHLFGQDDV